MAIEQKAAEEAAAGLGAANDTGIIDKSHREGIVDPNRKPPPASE
jgi:hypothetical protein